MIDPVNVRGVCQILMREQSHFRYADGFDFGSLEINITSKLCKNQPTVTAIATHAASPMKGCPNRPADRLFTGASWFIPNCRVMKS